MELLLDIVVDSVMDTVRLFPFLFLTYLAMEYLENRAGTKTVSMLLNANKKGPLIGGILGAVPQCGFSAAAANLYSGRVITTGTLIAVFLSTSDEMLPILISGKADPQLILYILAGKALVGIIAGILVDLFYRKRKIRKDFCIHEICERDHCHCESGSIIHSSLIHSLRTAAFILLITGGINLLVELIGMDNMMEAVTSAPVISIFLTALVGLLPNCAASVSITAFYVEGMLSLGAMFAGLLSCAGIGLLVLFRTNKNWKENLSVVAVLYSISVICGIALDLIL